MGILSTTDRLIWRVALWEEGFGDVESKGERLDRTWQLEWISVAKNIPRIGQISGQLVPMHGLKIMHSIHSRMKARNGPNVKWMLRKRGFLWQQELNLSICEKV